MTSPYAPHKARAFLHALVGTTLILLGLQIDYQFGSFVCVLVGTYVTAVAATRMIRIWAHEQRALDDARAMFRELNRASLPRQIFWLLLGVAEVDGRAGSRELEMVRRFVLERFLDPSTLRDLAAWEAHRIDPHQVDALAFQLRRMLSAAECESVFFWCCQITFADGAFNPDEHAILHRVARGLGLDGLRARAIFHHAKADFLGGGRRRSDGAPRRARSSHSPRERALEVLGLDGEASDEQIRKRHRELVKQYHPDAHAHLGPVAAEEAATRFREIQSAYEQLLL